MTIDLVNLILLYPLVFLAVVFGAWLAWRASTKRRLERERLHVACRCCGVWVPCDEAAVWVRCPECGCRTRLAGREMVRRGEISTLQKVAGRS